MVLSFNHTLFKTLEQDFKSQSKLHEHSKLILNGLDTQCFVLEEVLLQCYNEYTILKGLLYQFIKCIIKMHITSAICGRINSTRSGMMGGITSSTH